jgi:hypothetical protein
MTKTEHANRINEIIAGSRGEFARSKGAAAVITAEGKLRYRDTAKGYARRISFAELCRYLHGEDIRSLRGVS